MGTGSCWQRLHCRSVAGEYALFQPGATASRHGTLIHFGTDTNMPVMAIPGQQVGYPGAGGPPPFMQPPPGYSGNGGKGRGSKKKRRFPIWARVLTSIFLLLLVVTGGLFTYYELYFAKPISDITNQQVQRAGGEEDPNQGRSGDILSGPRINILLLGSDTDQKFGTSVGG